MFIREIRKPIRKDGRVYEYVQHRLVESVRTPKGPRQRNLLNLGRLEIAKDRHKALANLIETILSKSDQTSLFEEPLELVGLATHFAGIITRKRLQTEGMRVPEEGVVRGEESALESRYETVDVHTLCHCDGRTVGAEHIALSQLRQLGFFDILDECSFTEREQQYAAAQICGRMVHPDSERETARWLRETSGVDELLGTDFTHISDRPLHRVADRLLEKKDSIEKCLSANTRDLFSLDDRLILYDLTNSYFESPKSNSAIAGYAKSKEKRMDCPLITLALVVDGYGFPKRSRILEGNVSEPGTLWKILEELEIGDTDGVPITIVMDAGIATEENLQCLREDNRFDYVAISRKKKFQEDLFFGSESRKLTMSKCKELTVKTARYGDETLLLCQSPDRAAKDEAIFSRRRNRFEKGLTALSEGLKKPRTRKGYASVLERIGRLKERYKVGNFYTLDVEQKNGMVMKIKWRFHADKQREPGEYIIRTSRHDLLENELSTLHRTLTMIESAFRWLKSSLGLRPNYHQLDKRMSAHVFISVLAYFVLAPILNKLQWGGEFVGNSVERSDHSPWDESYGWKGIVGTMASQTRVTSSFLCEDGRRMDVRTTLEPTTNQRQLYKRLKINPKPLRRIVVKEGEGMSRKNPTEV